MKEPCPGAEWLVRLSVGRLLDSELLSGEVGVCGPGVFIAVALSHLGMA